MWQIKEIKNLAHFYMNTAYWRSVLAALVLAILSVNIGGILAGFGCALIWGAATLNPFLTYDPCDPLLSTDPFLVLRLLPVVCAAALIIMLIGLCISLFVRIPLTVGCLRFFIVNHALPGRARSRELFFIFSNHFLHVVKTMVQKEIYLLLWSLLLIFPGIIKRYSYRMVPYILAEEPGMPSGEVIRLSRNMMRGNKWHAFLLDLSFLGWRILNVLTLGILGLFYVRPYRTTANAELYITLRDQYLRHG